MLPKSIDIFCEYFAGVARKIDEKIPFINNDPLSYLHNINPNSFFASLSTPREVANLILSMPNKKCNLTSVPVLCYKYVVEQVSVIISDSFNVSIEEGIFLECLKLAHIIPIFKSTDNLLAENYIDLFLFFILFLKSLKN